MRMHRDHRGAGACGATSGAEPKKAGEARRPKLVPTSLEACGAIFRTSSVFGGLGGRVVGCAGEVRRWSWVLEPPGGRAQIARGSSEKPIPGQKSHGTHRRSSFKKRNIFRTVCCLCKSCVLTIGIAHLQ